MQRKCPETKARLRPVDDLKQEQPHDAAPNHHLPVQCDGARARGVQEDQAVSHSSEERENPQR